MARQDNVKVWHFAHAGDQDGPPCSGGESGLHKYGKQVLCEAVGKVVHLPHKSNREFYGGYHGMLRVSWATQRHLYQEHYDGVTCFYMEQCAGQKVQRDGIHTRG